MVTKFLFRADRWRSAKLCTARPRTGRRWVRAGTWRDRLGKPAGSAPDATRNSATAFPRSSAVPAGASAWNEDGRWTRAAGGETPHRAERCGGTGRGCGGRVGRLGRGAARRRPGPLPLPGRTGPSWGDVARDDEYVDYLQLHPDEFTALFNTILINVTNFLPRQRRGEQLRTQLLPELLHRRGPTEPIRLARTRVVGSPRRTPLASGCARPGTRHSKRRP